MHCLLVIILFNRMMSDLNYNHLRYFWAVARDGNLTRTAEGLNVSQSALSVQIKKLEDRLGHALFERRGRQLHLTEAGRITLDHADTIFATGHELLGTLRETGVARQAVRIGALATFRKDIDQVVRLAGDHLASVPMTARAAELYRDAAAHPDVGVDADVSRIIRMFSVPDSAR